MTISKSKGRTGNPLSEKEKLHLSELQKENHRLNPTIQRNATEAARQANFGTPRSEETKRRISESNLASEARKAYAASVTGIPRSEEVWRSVSEGLRNSEKAAAHHANQIGKSTAKSNSGHYGVSYDKSKNKYMVRIKGKFYGRYATMEEAVSRSQELMATCL